MTSVDGMRLFVFGCGFSGKVLARHLADRAEWIGGTARDGEGCGRLAALGIQSFCFDGSGPGQGVADALTEATHVVLSVPPGEVGDPVLIQHGGDLRVAGRLQWLGYLSTVGVYGDQGGAWVDEATPPDPARGRSTARLAAEQVWSAFAEEIDVPLGIFRLAGIYGPGRNAFVNLAAGTARRIVKPGQVFNRIHVDDVAAVLAAAMALSASGIYNLADDEPAPPQDVVAFAAELMGVDPPPEIPFDAAELSPMARSFYSELKRVRNDRIKDELGVALAHPSYREALAAMWRDRTWRG